MMLRQSTSQAINFGPFLDSTDGVTPETALTIAQADMQLSKDGAAYAQKSAAGNATHDTDGHYTTTLSTTDTATVGILKLQVNVSGSLPVWERFYVVEESVYDNMYASSAVGPLTAAQVNTEVDTALTDYDGPTNAEMVARTLVSASYATAAALTTVDANVVAILVDTGTTIPATLTNIEADTTLIPSLNDIDAATVKTQVVNAISVDTYAEPGQGTPPATTTLVTKTGYIYKNMRNTKTQTATQWSLLNDDGVTVDQKSTVSDDGTTATKTEIVTGP